MTPRPDAIGGTEEKSRLSTLTPQQLWTAALGELQVRLARPVFDTFLQDTIALHAEGSCLVVGTESPFVAEYLEKRLSGTIQHTVEGLARRPLEVRFQVTSDGGPPTHDGHAAEPQAPTANGTSPPEPPSAPSAPLNARYSFDSFVVGSSNELANAAAVAAAATPGLKYNPVFLYSGVGLGKTHLLHAVGHQLAANGLRVLYVSSDQFTTEFVRSIREGRAQQFRAKYRSADALLIDDVQFLSGKEQTQEGLFHIFNELHHRNRQIVIAADRSPKALTTLEDRLRSRFEWGLIADIHPPDLETRLAILRAKADRIRIPIPDEVIELIGRRIMGSVRELEGQLNRVIAHADLAGQPVTLELATRAMAGQGGGREREPVGAEVLLGAVARLYRTSAEAMKGRRRDRPTTHARHMAMYLLREETRHSLSEIGRLLGGRDHSTVHHACEKIETQINADPALSREVISIREALAQATPGRPTP